MADPTCRVCGGLGWVCENHRGLPWDEETGCQCGAGEPCVCNDLAGLPEGFVVIADINGNGMN